MAMLPLYLMELHLHTSMNYINMAYCCSFCRCSINVYLNFVISSSKNGSEKRREKKREPQIFHYVVFIREVIVYRSAEIVMIIQFLPF